MLMNPVINLNGSSREALCRDRMVARNAILDAMKALQETAPHGRDYFDHDTWAADRAVYVQRFAALDAIANALMEEALAIMA